MINAPCADGSLAASLTHSLLGVAIGKEFQALMAYTLPQLRPLYLKEDSAGYPKSESVNLLLRSANFFMRLHGMSRSEARSTMW